MKKQFSSELAVQSLEALDLPQQDALAVFNAAQAAGDTYALGLLMVGVRLKAAAARERQGAGIEKALKEGAKYKGRAVAALKLKGTKLQLLKDIISRRRMELARLDEDEEVPDWKKATDVPLNLVQLAKQLKIGRATLYRYLKMSEHGLEEMLLQLRKAERQRYHKDHADKPELAELSVKRAKSYAQKALKDSGLKKENRPALDVERAKRKAKEQIDAEYRTTLLVRASNAGERMNAAIQDTKNS